MFLAQHNLLAYADNFYDLAFVTLEDLYMFNTNLKENIAVDSRLNKIVSASSPAHFLKLRDCLNCKLKEGKHGYVGLVEDGKWELFETPKEIDGAKAVEAADKNTLLKIVDENPQWNDMLNWKADIEKGVPLRDLTCVTANDQGRVTKIEANCVGVTGTLPPSIGMLDALECLYLPGNGDLTGGIPKVRSLSLLLFPFFLKPF